MNKLSTILIFCLLAALNVQGQWQAISFTPVGRQVNVHFWDKDEGILSAMLDPYFVKTHDGGQNWDTVHIDFLDATSNNLIEMQFVDRNLGFVCGGSPFSRYFNILMRTLDGGLTWDSLIVNKPNEWQFQGMDFHAYDTELVGVLHAYQSVYKIEDSGRTLVQVPPPPGMSGFINDAVLAGRRLLVSTGWDIYATDNWGANWTKVHSDTIHFGKMAFHEMNGLAMGEKGWMLRSHNLGNSWVMEKIETDSVLFHTIKYAPNGDAYLLGGIAEAGYVYGSGNFGRSWNKVLVDPDFEYFADISMPTRDTGYIITSHIVYKTTTGGGLTLAVESILPANDDINLYPNPASNRLHIQVPTHYDVHAVAIYDAMGRLTKHYDKAPGGVDVSNLAPGNYFIKIDTDKGMRCKRLIVQ